ncbi:hypothetical protein FH608_046740 [Nonomuraea phyllanthi]|uniref:Uncharacterized protein n=1 Tax=Nonomuraea phyllanthi TaxID=2219224 RepID=A0A5C4V4C5_9ACTN|nr:hypothetical protein [Nonomuraea phyllanthi]KAB8186227.1 hypothetical protein FH608_046740 [Nonomuraea phyllanthi]QFY11555.1 hypothetical protein GBF35_37720 [Nonomuraea phyllanthi]
MIDPTLHPEISVELRSSPHLLRMARSGARVDTTKNPAALFILPALTVVLSIATGMQILLIPGIGLLVIVLFRWMAADSTYRSTKRKLRLARENADRFILPEDLDHPCQMLLRRAQNAVQAIMASRVHKDGLIDSVDNQVSLPEEVWQIAQRLRRLSSMHAEHGRLVPRELPPGMEDAFKPYTEALDTAWTSLSYRVRRLEKYAKQVLKADKAYHAHRRLEALAAKTPEYQQLIADTVRDELARERIRELADQAAHVRKVFEESILQARQAAGELLRAPLTSE